MWIPYLCENTVVFAALFIISENFWRWDPQCVPSCTYCASQSQVFPLVFPSWIVLSLSHLCGDRNQTCLPWIHFSLILIRFVRLCVIAARRKGYFLNSRWLLQLHIITAAESWCSEQSKISILLEQLLLRKDKVKYGGSSGSWHCIDI